MTDTVGYFGIPKIVWGDSLENTIFFDYPLYDWVTRSEALEGSQFLRIESGYEDSWIVNISYVLEANVQFITQDKWDNDWVPFLQWARDKNKFNYYKDFNIVSGSNAYVESYLVEPIQQSPTIEPDGTRDIRLVIRNSIKPYEIGIESLEFVSGSIPSASILLLDNSVSSYPGSGNIWYDISGNNINFTVVNTPTFNRSTGFDLNGTSQYFNVPVSSSFGSYWNSTKNVPTSLTLAMVLAPDTAKASGLFMAWGYAGTPLPVERQYDERKFKFAMDQNSDGTLELTTYSNPSTNGTGSFASVGTSPLINSQENIILWEITDTRMNVYRTTINIDNSLTTTLIGTTTAGISSLTNWFNADPEVTIGNARNGVTAAYESYFDGKIRAVAAYNRLLNPTEKLQLYNYFQDLKSV